MPNGRSVDESDSGGAGKMTRNTLSYSATLTALIKISMKPHLRRNPDRLV